MTSGNWSSCSPRATCADAAVDLLAGVGAGLEVLGGQDPFAGPVSTLFTEANRLGAVGVMALLVGSILALGVLWPSLGPPEYFVMKKL